MQRSICGSQQSKCETQACLCEAKLCVISFHLFPFVSFHRNWTMWRNGYNNRRRHLCLSFLYHLKPISISTAVYPGAFGMAPFLSTLEMKYRSFRCQRRANKSFRDFWLDWLSDTGLFELTFCGEKPDTTTHLFTASSGSFGCHFLFGPAALVLLPGAAIGWRYRWRQVYCTQQVTYIPCQQDDEYLLCFGTTTKDKFLSQLWFAAANKNVGYKFPFLGPNWL